MSHKILTIDDSKTIRMIVTKAFKAFNCSIFEAENGVAGLAVAAREKPDLILLDYTMPVMDGFETLTKLRMDPDLKNTPVIMLTAEAGRETVLKIAKLAVRDYLVKPFKDDGLIERATKILPLRLKSEAIEKARRFDDAIKVLVVDDKPAIVDQVRAGVSDTPWQVSGASQVAEAAELCASGGIDIVFVSLSLPQEGAFTLFTTLRGNVKTRLIPIVGLSVKTAAAEQTRAQQDGFSGCVTKPIDSDELKSKVCRSLRLETSYRYFQQRGNALCLLLPKVISPGVAFEVSRALKDQLTATVDAGNNKLLIDMTEVERASVPVIELALSAIQTCRDLALRPAIFGSETLCAEFRNFEETQNWAFAPTFDQALALVA